MLRFLVKEIAATLLVLTILPPSGLGQEFLPSPPSDEGLIYRLDDQNKLVPLPYEEGRTPLNATKIAKSTKTSYVELKGGHAAVVLSSRPRLFFFTPQRTGSHPPFLVRLTPIRGARRANVIAEAGLTGLAISSEEIVKPTIRVLATVGDKVFMELRPRTSLALGEYAIIGEDLTRIATFRVATDTMR